MTLAMLTMFTMMTADAGFVQAIRARDAAKVEARLASEPALAEAKTAEGMSAVTAALFTFDENRSFIRPQENEVLRVLLARKPKLDLHETAAVGSGAALEPLLAKDRSLVAARTGFGWTPLHYAAFAGNLEAIRVLVAHGADIHVRATNRFRNTPLIVAALTKQNDAVKLLLDAGADVLDRQAGGFTALHEAAFTGNLELARLLLDRGAELNSRTDDGRTPLSEALRAKHDAVAEFLRAKGAVAGPTGLDLMKAPE